jgi:hypothetical protein
MNIRAMKVTPDFVRIETADGKVMTLSRQLMRIRALAAVGDAVQRERVAADEIAGAIERYFGSQLIGRGCVRLRFDVDTGRPSELTVSCPDGEA